MQTGQIRPNYAFISVLAVIAVTLFIIYTTTYNGTLFDQKTKQLAYESSRSRLLMASSSNTESSYDAAWEQMLQDLRSTNDFYGVMFDAGSTGTRVHIFHFQNSSHGRLPLLVSEVFNKTERGLGEFADYPEEAVEIVENLLRIAMKTIPAACWASTPVALKATAGLRMIPQEKSQALLDAVYELFLQSPLLVGDKNSTVSIIDGIHEGEFIWFTVNFLKGVLGSRDHSTSTMGVLDLGGGSTQITFAPRHRETIEDGMPLGLIKRFRFMMDSFQLYTHSYLGLGLKTARLGTLKLEQRKAFVPISTKPYADSDTNFSTVCLPPNTKASWEFAGVRYSTWSSNSPAANVVKLCLNVTKQFLGNKVYSSMEIKNRSFYASSYFLGKAVESGLITRKFGGIVRVKDFHRVAEKACTSFDASNPFLCMDLVYISTLLRHGYGFSDETELVMNERIQGFQISWALGATIDLLHKHWDSL